MKQVQITTDGSCYPNPGPGGWAAVIRFNDSSREISGADLDTTNNRMELRAVIEGLKLLKEPCQILIRTDSQNTILWCKSDSFETVKKRIKFPEAWIMVQEYREVSAQHEITFSWVPGHTGDLDNERCDVLAAAARRSLGPVPAYIPETSLA